MYAVTSCSMRTCRCTGVLLSRHSPTCIKPGNSTICMAAGSPPVPKLGSNATTYMLPLLGFRYQRTCPCRSMGSMPAISTSFNGLIKVSSKIINRHSISLKNLSSPSCARICAAQASSRPGVSCHLLVNARNPFLPNAVVLPYSSKVSLAARHICAN